MILTFVSPRSIGYRLDTRRALTRVLHWYKHQARLALLDEPLPPSITLDVGVLVERVWEEPWRASHARVRQRRDRFTHFIREVLIFTLHAQLSPDLHRWTRFQIGSIGHTGAVDEFVWVWDVRMEVQTLRNGLP